MSDYAMSHQCRRLTCILTGWTSGSRYLRAIQIGFDGVMSNQRSLSVSPCETIENMVKRLLDSVRPLCKYLTNHCRCVSRIVRSSRHNTNENDDRCNILAIGDRNFTLTCRTSLFNSAARRASWSQGGGYAYQDKASDHVENSVHTLGNLYRCCFARISSFEECLGYLIDRQHRDSW